MILQSRGIIKWRKDFVLGPDNLILTGLTTPLLINILAVHHCHVIDISHRLVVVTPRP